MRFVSLVAVLGIATLSIASIVACGGTSADEPITSDDPATDDGAAEEIKAAVIDESIERKDGSRHAREVLHDRALRQRGFDRLRVERQVRRQDDRRAEGELPFPAT